MSIASEISRLQGAKADIKTAIEGKGVTVPSATKLDGYADLVDAIPQGSTPTGTKQINISQNGTTTENVGGYANAEIIANVPNTYAAGDEGKVVSNGALVAQTSDTVTENDTYDTTLINSLTVNVSGGGGGTPVIGLVDTIEITSPVATISYTVPQLARDYGILWLVFDDVGMTYTDYVYFSVVNADASLTDNNGFYNSPATINKNCVCVFKPDMTIGNETLSGFSGTCWVGNAPSSNRIIAQSNPTVLKSKLYNANNTFTRGSIKIYGRTA